MKQVFNFQQLAPQACSLMAFRYYKPKDRIAKLNYRLIEENNYFVPRYVLVAPTTVFPKN